MSISHNYCGAETAKGKRCRIIVESPGQRCRYHLNAANPLNAKRMLKLAHKTAKATIKLGETATGSYSAFELAHPWIMERLKPLSDSIGRPLLESFWEQGFEQKNLEKMAQERKTARKKVKQLEAKYSQYSDKEKLAIERFYRDVLQYLNAAKVT